MQDGVGIVLHATLSIWRPEVGAFCYNALHIYGFGAVVLVVGPFLPVPLLAHCGGLWLAHAGYIARSDIGLRLCG
ncbi:DUF4260 family protein [Burkholderia glumae]|uniref:DUF4260 family protein n=1 Tax=Burkholderia glumae TaxID=337 RepID=UPI0012977756|nr:DUF4260 family protein [Burkholderia glumae]MCM2550665.1 DUF4260 domain-containing protein [Burkholderia glumae]NVE24267.1 DUF4260 family protein [Burkholderia glumae]QGA40383.1 DUF4260 family protein [Burkholderia glumae]QJP70311.1 DUF4260 family protein [Burkholderia glumae]